MKKTILKKHVFPWALSILLIGSLEFCCFGCAIKVPMVTNVDKLEIQEKLPIEAGLLITKETSSFIFRGRSDGLYDKGTPREFPLGRELEIASIQTFSQIFKKITLVRTNSEARNYRIIIEPQIEDFHFNFAFINKLNYAFASYAAACGKIMDSSKITVRVTIINRVIYFTFDWCYSKNRNLQYFFLAILTISKYTNILRVCFE